MSIDDKKDVVWEKAKTVRGKDPATVRQDPYGNEMLYNSRARRHISKLGPDLESRFFSSNG